MRKHVHPVLGAALLLSAAGGAAHSQTFTNIIDPLNPTFTQALGINNSNTIVGYGNGSDFNGFVLTLPPVSGNFTRENFTNPSPPPGTLFTQVIGIDANGDTVGFYVSNPTVGTTSGFGKGNGGPFFNINQSGFAFNQVLGVNEAGTETAGYSSTDPTGATLQQAFTFDGTSFTNINALLPANFNSQATGVNDAGTVVGFYQDDTAGDFSAFTDKAGVITSFEVPGSTSTQALGVNDKGEIVGDYVGASGQMFGFLDNGGVFSTINPPGATSSTANGINDLGRIVGFYSAANGDTIGFVTSTVPEPATWALLASGFLGLALVGARARRAGPRSVGAQAIG